MRKRKICVVITARPSYARVKTMLHAIQMHASLELQLVLAGSALLDKYGDVGSIAEKDGFTICERIYNLLSGAAPTSMAKTTGLAIMELATAFQNLKPDIVVTIADRFETIATSIAASYQNIPLAHIQGGEVTGSIDEKVRHANTKFADLHLVASESARQRVLKMGEHASSILNTGCPSMDIARAVLEKPAIDFNPIEKYGGVGAEIAPEGKYIVVMQHAVTTEEMHSRVQIEETIKAVTALDIPTFWFWPNVDLGGESMSSSLRHHREEYDLDKARFFKNMEPEDFLRLIKNSACLIGNSSVGIRECAFLGVPVVNIGSRQTARERGQNVVDCGHNAAEIEAYALKQIAHGHYASEPIYGNGHAGKTAADALAAFDLKFHKTLAY
ncbi:UDP-N-acetylglucosamine 2-epimerase [Mesorhizobium sp. CN2-181]|uniref:UDP-N-acetylglucosamine 2-epimerase n=1 Tax=Mesorhizobium yinganensis TaxID=3157707 RepID=UPI0032B74376